MGTNAITREINRVRRRMDELTEDLDALREKYAKAARDEDEDEDRPRNRSRRRRRDDDDDTE